MDDGRDDAMGMRDLDAALNTPAPVLDAARMAEHAAALVQDLPGYSGEAPKLRAVAAKLRMG